MDTNLWKGTVQPIIITTGSLFEKGRSVYLLSFQKTREIIKIVIIINYLILIQEPEHILEHDSDRLGPWPDSGTLLPPQLVLAGCPSRMPWSLTRTLALDFPLVRRLRPFPIRCGLEFFYFSRFSPLNGL